MSHPIQAKVFNIVRGSLHDGEGIRTVVYLKGCTLRCAWCHNPEGISPRPEILYYQNRCIHCGRCVELCPKHHSLAGDQVTFQRRGCTLCMRCVKACPNQALVACGDYRTPDQVFEEIIKDRHYYDSSGGGVTFSGGECLLYPEFLIETLKLCAEAGVHSTLESAFNVAWKTIEDVYPYVNTFFVDIKHPDAESHKQWTGDTNQRILKNLHKVTRLTTPVRIRIPLIPRVNDADETLLATCAIINDLGPAVQAVELLKYNPLGESKFAPLGSAEPAYTAEPQNDVELQQKSRLLQDHLRGGIRVIYD